MSKLQQERIEKIKHVMVNYGIPYGKHHLISLWDLVGNLNNTWQAQHFLGSHHFDDYMEGKALREFRINLLFSPIKSAIRSQDEIVLMEGESNGVEFLRW